jgi:ubiquinone/menaquinone biosynthesis C-methylase UbiE
MSNPKQDAEQLEKIREFYDSVYHQAAKPDTAISGHLLRLARKMNMRKGLQVLDVACGTGTWLQACWQVGAAVAGIDLSQNAVAACRMAMPDGEFHAGPAETLPFEDKRFDVITCLGSLEHFVDPQKALREMVRVSKSDALFVLLVPNADFLTRRLGLYKGTYQVEAKEDVKTLEAWQTLFASAGLTVLDRWRDLHVLTWSWMTSGRWSAVPFRAVQALALAVWPLRWQYQVYHLCKVLKPS